jgi:hypothetical protein
MTEAQAYIAGWRACMAGCDGRYPAMIRAGQWQTPSDITDSEISSAWTHGWLDAFEAEDGEEPEPACAGYDDSLPTLRDMVAESLAAEGQGI